MLYHCGGICVPVHGKSHCLRPPRPVCGSRRSLTITPSTCHWLSGCYVLDDFYTRFCLKNPPRGAGKMKTPRLSTCLWCAEAWVMQVRAAMLNPSVYTSVGQHDAPEWGGRAVGPSPVVPAWLMCSRFMLYTAPWLGQQIGWAPCLWASLEWT